MNFGDCPYCDDCNSIDTIQNKERKIEFRGTYDPEDPPIIFNDSEFVFRVFRGGNNG
jgi:hypothetical protein